MSTNEEKARAIAKARQFMLDLLDPKKTKRVPKEIRDKAGEVMKHFPHAAEISICGPSNEELDLSQITEPGVIRSASKAKKLSPLLEVEEVVFTKDEAKPIQAMVIRGLVTSHSHPFSIETTPGPDLGFLVNSVSLYVSPKTGGKLAQVLGNYARRHKKPKRGKK